MQLLTVLSATAALFGTTLAIPAKGGAAKVVPAVPAAPAGNKPTGGPASASVSIYPTYTCTDPNTPPPTDGSVGTVTTVTVTENQCVTVNIPLGGAFTASMTAPPKTGAVGCYIQLFKDQGCGVTLTNQYHGFPFNGLTTNSFVGCAAPPVQSYGALQIVCG